MTPIAKMGMLSSALLWLVTGCASDAPVYVKPAQPARGADVIEPRSLDAAAAAPRTDPQLDQRMSQMEGRLNDMNQRLDKVDEIRRYLVVARGQLDLIENSFQLIADQIVTMHSPQELSGQLDELLDGVEAIRETTRDTEELIASVERMP